MFYCLFYIIHLKGEFNSFYIIECHMYSVDMPLWCGQLANSMTSEEMNLKANNMVLFQSSY
jgi:hypothetical protein